MSFLVVVSIFLSILLFPAAAPALAHCPLCVAGAAAGITLTRWIGVDDSITGVWVAAFLGAVSFWTLTAFEKRWRVPFAKPLLYLAIFATTLWSFYQFQLVIRMSQIMGLDKLTFGMVSGGILFYLIDVADDLVIKKNGHVLFPYQRLVVSLGSMVVLSVAIYLMINYFI